MSQPEPAAEWVATDRLTPWESNPRRNDHAVEQVAASIERFGFASPIIARPGGEVIAGHTRLKAAQHLGLEKVPVRYLDLTDTEARALALADNRLGELAEWDDEGLAEVLRSIQAEGAELGDLGWDEEALASLFSEEPAPGDASETIEAGSNPSLVERFGVPPFSVFDARQGYWQDRKRWWLAQGIDSLSGRDAERLTYVQGNRSEADLDEVSRKILNAGAGTSIFDPVLCEIVYRWWLPRGQGAVLDPFAGGSVRGIVASALGCRYTGHELRAEQVEANEAQLAKMPTMQREVAIPDNMPELTPVEVRGDIWVKREDAFVVGGVSGGKVRTCYHLARGATGLVTAGSRASPQVNIVAHIAAHLGIPCRVHVPSGKLGGEVKAASQAGAEVVQHQPGYNTVIVKRARDDAKRLGWCEIPFGMECFEAVQQTRKQVANIPEQAERLVMPVGSGMSLAGVLHGLLDADISLPVVGVVVGADPTNRLDTYAPAHWREMVELVESGSKYEHPAKVTALEGLELDPHYEAKCIPHIMPGDVFWVVGIRQTTDPRRLYAPPIGASAADLMRGFRPVLTGDSAEWAPYLQAFEQTRPSPRFYASTAWLASQGKKFLWGVVDGCLVVVKRATIFKTRVLYLVLPPMSAVGDVLAERHVADRFLAAGVSVKVSNEDADAWGLDFSEVEDTGDNVERVYRCGDYVALEGATWKKWRHAQNRFAGLGPVTVTGRAAMGAAAELADRWAEGKDKASSVGLKRAMRKAPRLGVVSVGGKPVLAFASQALSSSRAVAMVGITQPVDGVDMSIIGHLTDVQAYAKDLGPDTMLTTGAAPRQMGAGLAAAKSKLRPSAEVRIGTWRPEVRFTEADWQACSPDLLAQSALVRSPSASAPTWVLGDSAETIPQSDEPADLVFSCPPYADLEVYSDDPRDISTMSYEDFLTKYRDIIGKAVARLRDNRFAVFVVGDLRDKKGFYRGFVGDTVRAFEDVGCRLYNEAALVTPPGSLCLRAGGRSFTGYRKLGKAHQNVLVFFKGDPRTIPDTFGPIVIDPDPGALDG